MIARARQVVADMMMFVACALIGWAECLDPAPKLPGADERMWQRFQSEIDKTRCDGG